MLNICFYIIRILNGDWGLGIGDWGLGIGPNPQSPIPNPNPQSPLTIIKIILFAKYYYIITGKK